MQRVRVAHVHGAAQALAAFASTAASAIYEDVNGQPATYFFDDLASVGPFTDWCSTEILAIRATLQGTPINYPVYLCRTRAP
jgi:hypothetical protein